MDHQEAIETLAIDKYLLNELNPEERDAFEDHYFSCQECAFEVKAGAVFFEHSREIFKEEALRNAALAPQAAREKPRRAWFAWLRPAFAIPALALMLGVVTFQNFVQLPAMNRELAELNSPAVLPSAYLKGGNVRGEERVVAAKPGEMFQLTIDIPDSGDSAYVGELSDEAGKKTWSLAIPANAPKSGLSLRMPGDLPAGNYVFVVKRAGTAASGQVGGEVAGEVARYAFTLQRQ
jgi:Putative zinc-finger